MATPRKCPGRARPRPPSRRGRPRWRSRAGTAPRRPARTRRRLLRPPRSRGRAASSRGYASRSVGSSNCAGLTNSDITTRRFSCRAARRSATWPSWRAPIVGTRPRRPRRRLSSAIVRTTFIRERRRRSRECLVELVELGALAADRLLVRLDRRPVAAGDRPGQLEAVLDRAAHQRHERLAGAPDAEQHRRALQRHEIVRGEDGAGVVERPRRRRRARRLQAERLREPLARRQRLAGLRGDRGPGAVELGRVAAPVERLQRVDARSGARAGRARRAASRRRRVPPRQSRSPAPRHVRNGSVRDAEEDDVGIVLAQATPRSRRRAVTAEPTRPEPMTWTLRSRFAPAPKRMPGTADCTRAARHGDALGWERCRRRRLPCWAASPPKSTGLRFRIPPGGCARRRELVKLLALADGHRLHREQAMDALWPDRDPGRGGEQPQPGRARREEGAGSRGDRAAGRAAPARGRRRRRGVRAGRRRRAARADARGLRARARALRRRAAAREPLRRLGRARARAARRELHEELEQTLGDLGVVPGRRRLPLETSSFVGREHELAELRTLLGRTRLLTLAGTGGAGRRGSRSSSRAAARTCRPTAPSSSSSTRSPKARIVPDAVAAALDLRALPGAALVDAIDRAGPARAAARARQLRARDRRGAALADALLRSAPRLTILATSREPLRVPGEVVFRVPSLAIPDPETRPSARGSSSATRPCACSSSAPARSRPASSSTSRTPPRWRASATASTACRSRSSSPRPVPTRSPPTRSPSASTTASGSCVPGARRRRRASRRSRRRSTGATSCSPTSSESSCVGWPSSPAASPRGGGGRVLRGRARAGAGRGRARTAGREVARHDRGAPGRPALPAARDDPRVRERSSRRGRGARRRSRARQAAWLAGLVDRDDSQLRVSTRSGATSAPRSRRSSPATRRPRSVSARACGRSGCGESSFRRRRRWLGDALERARSPRRCGCARCSVTPRSSIAPAPGTRLGLDHADEALCSRESSASPSWSGGRSTSAAASRSRARTAARQRATSSAALAVARDAPARGAGGRERLLARRRSLGGRRPRSGRGAPGGERRPVRRPRRPGRDCAGTHQRRPDRCPGSGRARSAARVRGHAAAVRRGLVGGRRRLRPAQLAERRARGRRPRARPRAPRRGARAVRAAGSERGRADVWARLANLAVAEGDVVEAAELFERARALRTRRGDRRGAALALVGLGHAPSPRATTRAPRRCSRRLPTPSAGRGIAGGSRRRSGARRSSSRRETGSTVQRSSWSRRWAWWRRPRTAAGRRSRGRTCAEVELLRGEDARARDLLEQALDAFASRDDVQGVEYVRARIRSLAKRAQTGGK